MFNWSTPYGFDDVLSLQIATFIGRFRLDLGLALDPLLLIGRTVEVLAELGQQVVDGVHRNRRGTLGVLVERTAAHHVQNPVSIR